MKKIVYISRESNSENLDFRLIRQYMEKEHPEYKNVILAKKIEEGIVNKIRYLYEIMKQIYHIYTSNIVILDTYCITASMIKHRKKTKIIQIWHALGAIKKFGYQSLDKPSGRTKRMAKIMHMHKNYDYVLAPSKETAKYYKEAFNVGDEKIKYIGMPRIDYILKGNENIKNSIYEEYPELMNKINILYVPTFRKGKKVEIDELVKNINTEKYNLIVKLHPLDSKNYNYKQKDGVIYEKKFKTYDLIKIADKIITDYSSLAIESALCNIPLYFYTYDIEEYKKDPGLNIDFENEKIGEYQATDAERILQKIDEEYNFEILSKFSEKYVDVNTDNCTGQLVDFMMRLVNNEKDENMVNEPSKEKLNI